MILYTSQLLCWRLADAPYEVLGQSWTLNFEFELYIFSTIYLNYLLSTGMILLIHVTYYMMRILDFGGKSFKVMDKKNLGELKFVALEGICHFLTALVDHLLMENFCLLNKYFYSM